MDTNQEPKKPAKTFDEAIREVSTTPAERAALEPGLESTAVQKARRAVHGEAGEEPAQSLEPSDDTGELSDDDDGKDPDALPEWAEFPAGYRVPVNTNVVFMRFKSAWTKTKTGDRWCMLFELTDREEQLGAKNARGEASRLIKELSKLTIRIIDGKRAAWAVRKEDIGVVESIETFWENIGPKCRQQIVNYYLRAHALDADEQVDFFANCLVSRDARIA